MNIWLKLTMDNMCMFSMPGESALVESFVFGREQIQIPSLSGMIKSKNSFDLGPHFCRQNKHKLLKKMDIWTMCKAVNCFSIIACVKFSIVTFHLPLHLHLPYCIGKICTDISPTNLCANWEDYMKAWNYIEIDFDKKRARNIPQ